MSPALSIFLSGVISGMVLSLVLDGIGWLLAKLFERCVR